MENGYIYSNILLKLYLKSLKNGGNLMMTNSIPYTPDNVGILSKVIGHDIAHVKEAIKICLELDLITILNTGEIWLNDIQNFIGKSSTEADRIREYRRKIKGVDEISYKCTPEIEIEKEKEKEKEIDTKKKVDKTTKSSSMEYQQLYTKWLNNNLTKHNQQIVDNKLTTKIKNNIKLHTTTELIKAIDNYSIVLQDDNSYFTHKYTFWDFVSRGYEKFLNELDPVNNYKSFNKQQPKQQKKQSAIADFMQEER
jgi:predicted phage replisome organizer